MKPFFGFTFIILFALCSIQCEVPKALATGQDDEIIIFADDATWNALQNVLRQTFEDTVFTPQPEKWFTLRREDFSQFNVFQTHKNRILIAPLNGEGPVAEYLTTVLDSAVSRLVREEQEFVFTKYDLHARQQLSMYLSAPTLTSLRAAIENSSADLLYFFSNMAIKRELASLEAERKYNNQPAEDMLLEQYGWAMTVQHDYEIAIDSASEQFFWMRRATPSDMERWIFVHWIPTDRPDLLTDEYVYNLRNTVTEKFLRTLDDDAYVEIAPYYLEIQQADFLGRFAYEMRGNWRFSDKTGGGPFVNYTFYDPSTKRIYVVDGSIFAPRVEKKKLILQVDGILHTFYTRELLTSQADPSAQ